MDFDSHAELIVTAAVGLVNAVTPGSRRGRPYQPPEGKDLRDAIGAAVEPGRTVDVPMTTARVPAFVALGAAIRPVFEHLAEGDIDRAAVLANQLLATYQPAPHLESHDGQPWHLHFHGKPHTDPSGWAGGMAVGLAMAIGGAAGRPPWRLPGAGLRPGLRRRVQERHAPVLLDRVPEPGQGRGPPSPRGGPLTHRIAQMPDKQRRINPEAHRLIGEVIGLDGVSVPEPAAFR